ncbi:hypothetical protein DL767_010586 [Monosporascus sp. MG133]|nr:hypothetical protein DL767_010586 [Monosporascus sp. MG133]
MAEPEMRRRRRPAVACTFCKRRKVRCSREIPCANCTQSKALCVYDNPPPLGWTRNADYGLHTGGSRRSTSTSKLTSSAGQTSTEPPSHPPSSLISTPVTAPSTSVGQPSLREVESLKDRIRQLEQQLTAVVQRSGESSANKTAHAGSERSTTRLGDAFDVHHGSPAPSQPPTIARNVSHKTRLFGQSHWINVISLFQDICEQVEPSLHQDATTASSGLRRCKILARTIKSQLEPARNTPATIDLPPKGVADDLVDCYLRTSESVYPVLHVPTFRQSYEALWVSDSEGDASFRVLLKLVMAIGATTYDEQFSMRASAVRWTYEAHAWLSEPDFKARLSIQTLQINILLLIAREATAVGGNLIWISAGSLIRRAISMGLHVDPAILRNRSVFVAETHRRLWNTILEIALRASLLSGGPPLISLDDFDTQPPGNFDDDQLMADDPIPKRDGHFTQVSIAIALRKSFPVRLAVTKFLNDMGSKGTYEETLRLDGELRGAFRVLHQSLQTYTAQSDGLPSSALEIRIVRFLMHRWILALHVPFFGPALRDTSYAYSKAVVVDMSLKIWYAAHPSSLPVAAKPDLCSTGAVNSVCPSWDVLRRLATCGSGFYRTVTFHACLLIAAVLRDQLQEDETAGFGAPLRPDLLAVLDDAGTWCLQCLQAGETNIKGYILTCVLKAAIDGLLQGIPEEQMTNHVIKAAEDCVCQSLPILEEKAAQTVGGNTLDIDLSEGAGPATDSTPPNVMDGWDFMVSDAALFTNWDDTEPMSWAFNNEA